MTVQIWFSYFLSLVKYILSFQTFNPYNIRTLTISGTFLKQKSNSIDEDLLNKVIKTNSY